MKISKMITSVLSAITGIYILFDLLISLFLRIFVTAQYPEKTNSASAIGIIGGADGPTAIFISKTSFSLGSVLPIIIFLVSVMINILLRLKIKFSQNSLS